MVSASKKATPAPTPRDPKGKGQPEPGERAPWPLRIVDGAFRYLASLNLAMISLSILVVYLTAGMFFERSYGNQALQDYFYRTPWFALLLGVLGMNILCAALIRFPWKKRQTGFVVTHAGLLVLILGSWISFQTGDEGQVGMVENEASDTLARNTSYRLRIQPIDPETRQPSGDGYAFPFYPGAFNWKLGRNQTLSGDGEPFELKVSGFYPASDGRLAHTKTSQGGRPMIRLGASVTPPGSTTSQDLFAADSFDQQKWLIGDQLFRRKVRQVGPVLFRFSYVDASKEPDAAEDFLDLPEKGTVEVLRVRYVDRGGQGRVARYFPARKVWVLPTGQEVSGAVAQLPESDLEVTYRLSGPPMKPDVFERLKTQFHIGSGGEHSHVRLLDLLEQIRGMTGEDYPPLGEVDVRKSGGAATSHFVFPAALVSTLAFVPSKEDPAILDGTEPLVRLSYFHPPEFGEGMAGTMGVVDVLGTSDRRLFQRAQNKEGARTSGPLKLGEKVTAFGGTPNQPVTMDFSVDEFIESGKEELIYVPIEMPVGQAGNGIPAARVTVAREGESESHWLRLGVTADLQPDPRMAEVFAVGSKAYQVWFDVDRKPLPFSLELVDFRRRFDPGVSQARSYESDVLLTDEERGIKEKKITIAMNEPLTHRGYTFYQSNFDPPSDASGKFVSVFQVRYDPTWQIVYIGCLMVVIGTFLQFYMRAGVFTDGGKREREKEAARATKAGTEPPRPEAPEPPGEDL